MKEVPCWKENNQALLGNGQICCTLSLLYGPYCKISKQGTGRKQHPTELHDWGFYELLEVFHSLKKQLQFIASIRVQFALESKKYIVCSRKLLPQLDTTYYLEGEEQYHYLVVISNNSEQLINLNTSCGRQGSFDCNCYHLQVQKASKLLNISNSGMDDTFVLLQIYAASESVTFHHFVLIKHEIFYLP